ncbi:GNAT family N-acetyltransferase [Bacteroidota bacterium]
MQIVKFLEGKEIYLRPFKEEDLEIIHFGKNDAHVRDTLFLFKPYTVKDLRTEIEEWLSKNDTVIFTICLSENNEAIGQTALFRIDFVSRAAIYFIAIYNPKFWSKGYGSETTNLVMKYAFDILNLNRIQLHVSAENEKGVKAYKKAGFKVEGTLKQAMYHNNQYFDFYVMGFLREEYYSSKE